MSLLSWSGLSRPPRTDAPKEEPTSREPRCAAMEVSQELRSGFAGAFRIALNSLPCHGRACPDHPALHERLSLRGADVLDLGSWQWTHTPENDGWGAATTSHWSHCGASTK